MSADEVGERRTFAGHVDEKKLSGFTGFLHWHFTCAICEFHQRMHAGGRRFNCSSCKTSYDVDADGNVYRVEQVIVSRAVAERRDSGTSVPRKGLLGRVMDSVVDANEEAHGKRLRSGLESTGASLKSLEGWVVERAMTGFLLKRASMLVEQANWSRDGRIKLGRELQDQARRKYDFDLADAHSLWLAGAWLESGARSSDDARHVRSFLDTLATELSQ